MTYSGVLRVDLNLYYHLQRTWEETLKVLANLWLFWGPFLIYGFFFWRWYRNWHLLVGSLKEENVALATMSGVCVLGIFRVGNGSWDKEDRLTVCVCWRCVQHKLIKFRLKKKKKTVNGIIVNVNFCLTFQIAHCYREELSEFPQQLIDLLKSHSTVLDPEMRIVRRYQLIFFTDMRSSQ